MKLEIDIDEKEFGVDIENKFQDFFKRLQAEIQNRLISNDTLVCGVYELETIEMFLTAFKNATIEQEPVEPVIESAYKTGYELGRSMAMIDCARDRV